jgi:hypothetical protein
MDGIKKLFTALSTVFMVACGCPDNGTGIDTKHKFVAEAKAACAAVEGCDLEYILDVPVYELTDIRTNELSRCDGALACFCIALGCSGVIQVTDLDKALINDACPPEKAGCWLTKEEIMVHEYVHASIASIGRGMTIDHPAEFGTAFSKATKIFKAQKQ